MVLYSSWHTAIWKAGRKHWKTASPARNRNVFLQTQIQNFTGSTVGIFEILLLFLPVDDDDVWLSSKSPPLTLLEGDVALLLFKAIINLWVKKRNMLWRKIQHSHQRNVVFVNSIKGVETVERFRVSDTLSRIFLHLLNLQYFFFFLYNLPVQQIKI